MILEKEKIRDSPHFIEFYHKEHKQLAILFLEKLVQALEVQGRFECEILYKIRCKN